MGERHNAVQLGQFIEKLLRLIRFQDDTIRLSTTVLVIVVGIVSQPRTSHHIKEVLRFLESKSRYQPESLDAGDELILAQRNHGDSAFSGDRCRRHGMGQSSHDPLVQARIGVLDLVSHLNHLTHRHFNTNHFKPFLQECRPTYPA